MENKDCDKFEMFCAKITIDEMQQTLKCENINETFINPHALCLLFKRIIKQCFLSMLKKEFLKCGMCNDNVLKFKISKYQLYCLAGSALNSLYRRILCKNMTNKNRMSHLTVLDFMKCKESEMTSVPNRLRIENQGGMKIISPDFYWFTNKIVSAMFEVINTMSQEQNRNLAKK